VSAGPRAVVRRPEHVPGQEVAAGVTVAGMLDDRHGCRGLHQRRLRLDSGTVLTGAAGGQGEAWYVISGSGTLSAGAAGAAGAAELAPGTAVWLGSALAYQVRAGSDLEVLACTVLADTVPADMVLASTGADSPDADSPDADRPGLLVRTLAECVPERTGDREFRVLLSEGLTFTQFAGTIPPGRAPQHQHTYDEVVHVLAGTGVAHLPGGATEIGPGTSVYLPPHTPHCLENLGPDVLQVLGVFHPAGSPAAKRES
jgi:mannose-6-phosphate isomerase-like protein (cupin superfamily)